MFWYGMAWFGMVVSYDADQVSYDANMESYDTHQVSYDVLVWYGMAYTLGFLGLREEQLDRRKEGYSSPLKSDILLASQTKNTK